MQMSELLFKPTKQPPANADTINHRLLTQAGFIRQLMAGVYTYTPLGLRTLRKIENVVRNQMDKFGSQEIHMPALHPKANWLQTGAWDSVDVLFKLKSRTDREYALGQSHEEIVTPLIKEHINSSLKNLPLSVYQIQWKFRDELRAKSGILRGREFLMKDMYSFHANQEDFLNYYQKAKTLYLETFAQLGLEAKATEASGGSFTDKISYEFMVLTPAGEDDILYCDNPDCAFCINTEINDQGFKEGEPCPRCGTGQLHAGRASEAGNIFDLGTVKSAPFGLTFTDSQGQQQPVYMGCYGIGISRAMGIIVEKNHDEQGIVWPAHLAPYQIHLLNLSDQPEYFQLAQTLATKLEQKNIEVLWDDRPDIGAGAKFASADLIGCPLRVVISPKLGLNQIEIKKRTSSEAQIIDYDIEKLVSML